MNVYVDESGDLGWIFDKPFRNGGSSRYLTITLLLVPKTLIHLPRRIVREIYSGRHQSFRVELKGSDLSPAEESTFAKKVIQLISTRQDIEVWTMTAKKEYVKPHIRQDSNKLYNYMIGLMLPEKIKEKESIAFIPDKRSVRVKSGNSLIDYLQIKIWFEWDCPTILLNHPEESDKCLNLQFTDFLTHIVWSNFENKENDAFVILEPHIKTKRLFF